MVRRVGFPGTDGLADVGDRWATEVTRKRVAGISYTVDAVRSYRAVGRGHVRLFAGRGVFVVRRVDVGTDCHQSSPSRTRRVASTSSGPVPSPRISVT